MCDRHFKRTRRTGSTELYWRPRPTRPAINRFLEKTNERTAEGCLPWIGQASGRERRAYLYFQGRVQPAARVIWILTNGEPPNGLHVLHACDNPMCVEISHLWLGTQADNNADMVRKGRAWWQRSHGTNP